MDANSFVSIGALSLTGIVLIGTGCKGGSSSSNSDGSGGAAGNSTASSSSSGSTMSTSGSGPITSTNVFGAIGSKSFVGSAAGFRAADQTAIIVTDWNDVCTTTGLKPNGAYVIIYLPNGATPGTFTVTENGTSPMPAGQARVNVQRRDATCLQTTDDYAASGTVTLTQADGTTTAGTLDASTTAGDHVSGSFTASCQTNSHSCTP